MKKDKDVQKYLNCLEEVKWRVQAIENVLNGASLGNETLDIEFVALQLRKVIELIAFSSLVANKKIYSDTYKNFHKHWNAKLLIQDLERVNPDFYQIPITFSHQDKETGVKHFKEVDEEFISKEDLIFLYEKCGAALHAHNPYKGNKQEINVKIPMIEWVKRIKTLLMTHRIHLVNEDKVWMVHMSHPDDGKVHALTGIPLNE